MADDTVREKGADNLAGGSGMVMVRIEDLQATVEGRVERAMAKTNPSAPGPSGDGGEYVGHELRWLLPARRSRTKSRAPAGR